MQSKLEVVQTKQDEGKEADGEDIVEQRENEHKKDFAKARANHYGNEYAAMLKARKMMEEDDEDK